MRNCCVCEAELTPEENGPCNTDVTYIVPTDFYRKRFPLRWKMPVEVFVCNKCLEEIHSQYDPGPDLPVIS